MIKINSQKHRVCYNYCPAFREQCPSCCFISAARFLKFSHGGRSNVSQITAGQGRLAGGSGFSLRSFHILFHINTNYPKNHHCGCCCNKMALLQTYSVGHVLCDMENNIQVYPPLLNRFIKPALSGVFYVNDVSN